MPELVRTSRLVLRKVTPLDRAAMLAVHGDPAANIYPPDRARSAAESDELLEAWLRDWSERGIGYWAVDTVLPSETIGFGGLRFAVRHGVEVLNLYCRLRPGRWGHGYATEMTAAAVSCADRNWPDWPVEVLTSLANAPMRRVAEKLGFRAVRSIPADGYTDLCMRRG